MDAVMEPTTTPTDSQTTEPTTTAPMKFIDTEQKVNGELSGRPLTDFLPGELKEDPTAVRFKNVNDLFKSYQSARTELSKGKEGLIKPVTEESTEEEKAAFRNAMGVPADITGYDLKIPEGVEANEEFLNGFKAAALKSNMPVAQAQAAVDYYNEQAAAFQKEESEKREAVVAGLEKAHGERLPGLVSMVKNEYTNFSPELQKAIKESSHDYETDPVYFMLANHFLEGRSSDTFPTGDTRTSQAVTPEIAEVKIGEIRKLMDSQKRNSPEYRRLDAELSRMYNIRDAK